MGKKPRDLPVVSVAAASGGAVDEVTEDKPAPIPNGANKPTAHLVNMNGSFQHADVNSSQYFVDHFRQRQKLH